MGDAPLDYAAPATKKPIDWRMLIPLSFVAGFVGLFLSLVSIMMAGHGGQMWPAVLVGGPWLGPFMGLSRFVHIGGNASMVMYLSLGALGYVGYVVLLLGPLRRFGYGLGIFMLMVFHLAGVLWSSAIVAWLS